MTKILLHSCCAPCSTAILEWLLNNDYEPVIYFYNPNIYPEEEYIKRKNELIRYSKELGVKYYDADNIALAQCSASEKWDDEHRRWKDKTCAYKDEPERGKRCFECFKYRLEVVAAFAEKEGIPLFTSSLASSRWKSIDQIFKAAHIAEENHPGTKFYDKNWRKGGLYERRNELAKQFYNQQYCGCEFSMPESLTNLKLRLKYLASKCEPKSTARFFKTGKGDYSENDIFTGVKVPQLRELAKLHYSLTLKDLAELITEPIHELRFIALLILIHKYESLNKTQSRLKKANKNSTEKCRDKREIVKFYLNHTKYINNWDLVDLSCHKILGEYIREYPEEKALIYKLFQSNDLWEKRIGIVSNWALIKKGEVDEIYKMAEGFVEKHDLIQKAMGWMLREAGKKDEARLITFIKENEKNMPRTTYRYAIERIKEALR